MIPDSFVNGVFAGVCIAVAVLTFISAVKGCNDDSGFNCSIESMQKEAIERGYAKYDSNTGEWKWKEKGGE